MPHMGCIGVLVHLFSTSSGDTQTHTTPAHLHTHTQSDTQPHQHTNNIKHGAGNPLGRRISGRDDLYLQQPEVGGGAGAQGI